MCLCVCGIPEPAHVSVCAYMGKGVHIAEDGDEPLVFAKIEPYLTADRPVKRLSSLMQVGQLLPLDSSSGNHAIHYNLGGYEGVVHRLEGITIVFSILLHPDFYPLFSIQNSHGRV